MGYQILKYMHNLRHNAFIFIFNEFSLNQPTKLIHYISCNVHFLLSVIPSNFFVVNVLLVSLTTVYEKNQLQKDSLGKSYERTLVS